MNAIASERDDQVGIQDTPRRLGRAVGVLVADSLAWGIAVAVAGLSGIHLPGIAWFAVVAAMTQLAVGQARSGNRLRARSALIELGVAAAVAIGFSWAANPTVGVNWPACLTLIVTVAVISCGARVGYALSRRTRRVEIAEPSPVCTFADTVDLHWLSQLEVRTAPPRQLAELGSRSA
jgi:peptidoglycan/LPS O-acetylase OafA/YrhL